MINLNLYLLDLSNISKTAKFSKKSWWSKTTFNTSLNSNNSYFEVSDIELGNSCIIEKVSKLLKQFLENILKVKLSKQLGLLFAKSVRAIEDNADDKVFKELAMEIFQRKQQRKSTIKQSKEVKNILIISSWSSGGKINVRIHQFKFYFQAFVELRYI